MSPRRPYTDRLARAIERALLRDGRQFATSPRILRLMGAFDAASGRGLSIAARPPLLAHYVRGAADASLRERSA